ncbi:hypothetical protein B0J12DRAFT_551665, partial [Macrophomina phaseolina]
SCLIQCRTNHNFLREFLYQLRKEESGQCECGQGMETVRHVLLVYPKWQQARSELASILGKRWGDASHMLGGWSRKE